MVKSVWAILNSTHHWLQEAIRGTAVKDYDYFGTTGHQGDSWSRHGNDDMVILRINPIANG